MTDLLHDPQVRRALDLYALAVAEPYIHNRPTDADLLKRLESDVTTAIVAAHTRQLVGTPDGMERLRVRVTATGAEVEVLRGRASVVVSDAEIARAATDPDTEALRRAVAETAGMEAPEEHICTKANTDDCLIGQECDGYWEEYRIAVIEAAAPHLLAPLAAKLAEARQNLGPAAFGEKDGVYNICLGYHPEDDSFEWAEVVFKSRLAEAEMALRVSERGREAERLAALGQLATVRRETLEEVRDNLHLSDHDLNQWLDQQLAATKEEGK